MLPDTRNVFGGAEASLDGLAIGCLGVDAYQRFGAAGTQEHPAAVGEVELETVVRPHALDSDASDLVWLVLLERLEDALAVALVGVALQMDVVAHVCMPAATLLESREYLRDRYARLSYHDVGERSYVD